MINQNNSGPQDPSRVNVSVQWDVDYWTKKFNCTREQLVKAVQKVGTSANAVERHFQH